MTDRSTTVGPRLRLKSAVVSGVLGEFRHQIKFDDESNFVIVYGPNGIGKTKLLEIIDALISLKTGKLRSLPFEVAELTFVDGSSLTAHRSTAVVSEEDDVKSDERAREGRIHHESLRIELKRPGMPAIEWQSATQEPEGFTKFLRHETTWVPLGPGTSVWQDLEDGEIADIDDLSSRFGWRDSRQVRRSHRPPAPLVEFTNSLSTHLIETQRLKIDEYMDRPPRPRTPARQPRTQSTIVGYAAKMRDLLSAALAENSRVTQQLDRTFPSRVLSRGSSTEALNEAGIREKYEAQNKFRNRLGAIALLGLQPELALPDRPLTAWEVSMLDLYLRDADNKLASFESLLEKIEALEQILNARLLRKRLSINAHDGIVVTHTVSQQRIELDSLSSGEQHEIILMFDLLFNVQPGSLVMIDEPEISLHVSWQVDFIADVERIAGLAGFQFVVATHSPQIINTWWSRANQLGPKDVDFFGTTRMVGH